MPVEGAKIVEQNTRQIHKGGPPWMYGQQNVRFTARDNTGQNIKDTHPVPEQKLKFLTSRERNAGHRVGSQGLYRPRHGDER